MPRVGVLILPVLLLGEASLAWAGEITPAADCGVRYTAFEGAESNAAASSLEAKLQRDNLTLKSNVYSKHADGSPHMVELSIEDPDGMSLASLEVLLRPGGDAYISHVKRDSRLASFRVSGWLKKKLVEKYPVEKISSTLSETEFARVEKGLAAKESPEVAARRSVAYQNCLELGFPKITLRLMANSLDLDCSR